MTSRHAVVEPAGGLSARALSDLLNKNKNVSNVGFGGSGPSNTAATGAPRGDGAGASGSGSGARGRTSAEQGERRKQSGQPQRGIGRLETGTGPVRNLNHQNSRDKLAPGKGNRHSSSQSSPKHNPYQSGRPNNSPGSSSQAMSRQSGGGPSTGRPPTNRRNRDNDRNDGKNAHASGSGSGNKPARQSESAKRAVQEVAAIVQEWAKSRIRAPGVLDLSGMISDQALLEKEIWPPGHPKALKSAPMFFWKVIAEVDPFIHAISFANNDFSSLRILSTLPDYMPHITALDLSGNVSIKEWANLEYLRPRNASEELGGFKQLKELILTGTGLANVHGARSNYAKRPIYLFPNLERLDNQPLPRLIFPIPVDQIKVLTTRPALEVIKAKPYTFPYAISGPLVHSDPNAMALIQRFAGKFFRAMDKDREELIYAYQPGATLSFHAVRDSVPRNNMQDAPKDHSKPKNHGWGAYPLATKDPRSMSRDLLYFREDKRPTTLAIAKDELAIREWLKKIPSTSHPVDDGSRWLMDTIEVPGAGTAGIMLIIHGEFEEGSNHIPRSFTRTLILIPAVPGGASAIRGWECSVISDTLSIRAHCSISALQSDLTLSGATIAGSGQAIAQQAAGFAVETAASPAVVDPSLADLPAEHQLFVMNFAEHTGLVIAAARDCAAAGNFDVAATMALFEAQRPTIPAELFRR